MKSDPHPAPQRPPTRDGNVISLAASQDRLLEQEHIHRDLLNALPAAIYTTDAEGRINFYNEAAVNFAGRRPTLGEHWCVTWRLYHLDGTPMAHDECPMAIALKEKRIVRNVEAIAERPDGSRVTFVPYPTLLYDDAGKVVGAVNMLVDITERKAAEEQQLLLTHEVNHRANNLLSVVQSIVRVSKGLDIQEYKHSIDGRIQALARAHALLAKSRWLEADLQSLVSEELAPYMGEAPRAWIGGSSLRLAPGAAQSLAMIIHELATNAAKYGALRDECGKVQIDWRVQRGDLLLHWREEREEGGDSIAAPTRSGVGSNVIRRAAGQLGASVSYVWQPSGLNFAFRGPAAGIVQPLH